ncbi:MAG: hypothetical protein JOZ41_10135, partial [Chloroflexi bacterium]|nr:hypothetical protein [Chloroflexota bacterium]
MDESTGQRSQVTTQDSELTAPGSQLLWFEDEACREPRVAGGKGASLAAMTAAGLPVPPGFVIPSHLLERAVDAEQLRELALAQDHHQAQAMIQA